MDTAPNLAIVGPMGAGKSAVGKRLAARLGLPFSDLDADIVAAGGRLIPDIFAEDGEAAFRELESQCLRERLSGSGRVLATGGGVVLDPANQALLCERACVVWLGAEVDTQLARVTGDDGRPLLRPGDPGTVLRTLAATRTPLYRKVADLRLETDELTEHQVLDVLEQMVRYRWQHAGDRIGAHVVEVGGEGGYRIHVGPGLLDDGALAAQVRGGHALVVSDANVGPLYAGRVAAALSAGGRLKVGISTVVPGESSKSLDGFADLLSELAELGATRDACVFALGGGVVGDLAGFAAACWMRGIDLVQLPTSLLAMVDSSVGGKTAIDVPQGKNLVGAFYKPRAVFADTSVLDTLPERELRAGLAEVVKYGAIADAAFLDWLATNAERLLARDPVALAEAIARSCAHKVAIVERDPMEQGERALLNFGHTFAHAIEAEQGYGRKGALNHGEAVAVGMVLAARLSAALGMAGEAEAAGLEGLLQSLDLPTRVPAGLEPANLVSRMRLDKKATARGLRFVLWEGPGRATVASGVPEAAVLGVLR